MMLHCAHALLILILILSLAYGCEKGNCSDDVTKQFMSDDHHQSRSNLAWLVTPALFALGLCYLVYKCCKDGLCNCRRLRERAAQEHQEEHGYIPLNEVALLSSSQIPYIHPSISSRAGAHPLVVIHNQTFCLALDPRQRQHGRRLGSHAHSSGAGLSVVNPPTYQEALLHGGSGGETYVLRDQQAEVVPNPPSYISSKPPRYSVAMGEESIHSSVSEDIDEPDIIVVSETRPRQLKFVSNRRRHRSAQDTHVRQDRHRHLSAQDRRGSIQNEDSTMNRQRCFSFNALKDAFKRSQQNVPSECESLLAQDESASVFSSRDNMTPLLFPYHGSDDSSNSGGGGVGNNSNTDSPLTFVTTSVITTTSRIQRRPPQQVSFEDRILEDSESNENLAHLQQHSDSISQIVGSETTMRQRHFSAPDTVPFKATRQRHSSGSS